MPNQVSCSVLGAVNESEARPEFPVKGAQQSARSESGVAHVFWGSRSGSVEEVDVAGIGRLVVAIQSVGFYPKTTPLRGRLRQDRESAGDSFDQK